MNTFRTLTLAGLALSASLTGASAYTGSADMRIPAVHAHSENAALYSAPNASLFSANASSGYERYTVSAKALHNGFDRRGDGVHPDIGPITD